MSAQASSAGGGAPARSRLGRLVRRLAIAGLSTALALAVLEGGHRLWLRARGEPYDRVALERALRRELDTTAAFVGPQREADADAGSFPILHPYFGAEKYPDTGGVLRFFEKGHAEGVYTVAVVGGSVAAFWAQDPEAALRKRLESDPRLGVRKVQVLMFAHSSYKQPQQVNKLAWLLAFGHRPDAVVNLDGFNETAVSYANTLEGTHPLYPSPPVWGAVLRDRNENGPEALEVLADMRALQRRAARLVDRALSLRLTASSLLGQRLKRYVDGLNAERSALRDVYVESLGSAKQSKLLRKQRLGEEFEPDDETILDLAVAAWFEGSLSLKAICEAQGIYYVHALQPTLLDAGSKPLTEKQRAFAPGPPGWQRGVELGYPRLRALGPELARRGVVFVDASQCFADARETLYFDTCHFLAAGNRYVTDVVADAFLASLPEPAAAPETAGPASSDGTDRGPSEDR